MARIAINGLGRIGRQTLKAGWGKRSFNVVAINDLTDANTLAYLLKYDSIYGIWDIDITAGEDFIQIGKTKIPVLAEKIPAKLPWGKYKVDIVIESTGFFSEKKAAQAHVKAGANRVIISAPGKGGVPTYVRGANAGNLGKEKDRVISNASCTTNCASPVMSVLDEVFGVDKAMLSTIHGYTATQNLVDGPHRKDLRRGRAAAENMIPTTTGAAKATVQTIPKLKGKFDGIAVRVPVPTVSLTDLTVLLRKKVTVGEVNDAFEKAKMTPRFKGVLGTTNEPLVSTDFIGNTHSAIVDMGMTRVVGETMVKVVAWYDNEWGYAHRLAEMALLYSKNK